jgi:putative transposase
MRCHGRWYADGPVSWPTVGGHCRFAVRQDGAKRGSRGYDAGKKVKGRKRHIAVDTLGLIWAVAVISAGIQDRTEGRHLLLRLTTVTHRIQVVFADGAYSGTLLDWVRHMFHWTLTIVSRRNARLFEVLPWRWLVERTFAWLSNARRLSKDYEFHPATSECFIQITMISLMLRHLSNTQV